MRSHTMFKGAVAAALMAAAIFVQADLYPVSKNDVIPIQFEWTYSSALVRVGDRVAAKATKNTEVPEGTEFLGKVDSVQPAGGDSNGSMEISFDSVMFPNGTVVPLTAVPIPLDKKYTSKDKDGRYVGKPALNRSAAVGGGALAGLLIGSLIHKPFEGTFIGTLLGIVVGETNSGPQEAVIKQGQTAGAYIQQTITLDDAPKPQAGNGVPSTPDQTPPPANVPPVKDIPPAKDTPPATNGQDQTPPHPIDGTAPVQADQLVVNGTQLTFSPETPPFMVGSSVMVPLDETAKQLHVQVSSETDYVHIDSQSHSLRLVKGTNDYQLDGKAGVLTSIPINKDGKIYVPIDVFKMVTKS